VSLDHPISFASSFLSYRDVGVLKRVPVVSTGPGVGPFKHFELIRKFVQYMT
jgi:hypothetical protein